jgi:hypothetical protein
MGQASILSHPPGATQIAGLVDYTYPCRHPRCRWVCGVSGILMATTEYCGEVMYVCMYCSGEHLPGTGTMAMQLEAWSVGVGVGVQHMDQLLVIDW